MLDIAFDITTREIIMTGSGSSQDFATTTNPSVQNGGILLYSRGANPLSPMIGIGLIPEVINGPLKDFVFEMNRWQAQAIQDGSTFQRWSQVQQAGGKVALLTEISYL